VTREIPRNLAASVRQRLFNLAQERREDSGLVLTKYGLERFLYRLAQSMCPPKKPLSGIKLPHSDVSQVYFAGGADWYVIPNDQALKLFTVVRAIVVLSV
jgi:hypothetical protein